ncbi:MAG: glycosyltransferase family 61 protein [Cyanobacteria bacterium J06634_6]
MIKIRERIKKKTNLAISHAFLGARSIKSLKAPLKSAYHPYPRLAEESQTLDSTAMHFLQRAQHLQTPTYKTPDIFTAKLHNICFSPQYNILHTQSHQIIQESISTQQDLTQFDIKSIYQKPVERITNVCTIFRSHKNGYYHTLIDNLPRLYLLHHPRFQDIEEIQLLCSSQPTAVEAFYLERLLPKNVKVIQTHHTKPYLLDDLIFPSFLSRRFSGYLPTQYRNWFIQLAGPKRPRQKRHRIFISRIPTHKGAQRCILNEEALYGTLRPYGFQRYVLENLSIQEQIDLFYDAEAVVAAHGAGLTNTLFSERIKTLEIFPMPFVVPHYYFLAKALGHQYRYSCSDQRYSSSNFSVNLSEISKILESYMS